MSNTSDYSKKDLFETMPVPRALMSMAVPAIISQLISLVYNMVDAFFLGRTGNPYMLAATSLTFTIVLLMVALSNLFGIGGGSQMARLIGQGRHDEAKSVSAFSLYGAVAAALLYSLVIGLFRSPILFALGASEATIVYAKQYVTIVVVCGSIPSIISTSLAYQLRNVGYSKQASFGLSSGGILNMLLDPLFMFVLLPQGMEVIGAALATLLSNICSLAYLLFIFCSLSKQTPMSPKAGDAVKISRENMKRLFAVGIPSSLMTAFADIASMVLNVLMAGHGDMALAGLGIVLKIERVPNAFNVGLCQGMLPIVAYNYSNGNHKRMNEVIRTSRMYGLVIAAVSVLLFEIFALPLPRLFMSTSQNNAEQALMTIGFAVLLLRIRCISSPLQYINYHASFCMQAIGNGKATILHIAVRQLVFYVPFMLIFDALMGLPGLAWALVAGELCSAIFALLLLKKIQKQGLSGM